MRRSGQTERQTQRDKKLIISYRNFAKTPENFNSYKTGFRTSQSGKKKCALRSSKSIVCSQFRVTAKPLHMNKKMDTVVF